MFTKQKSFSFGRYVPNDKVLNKRVPENPRYKHVKPAVDTGKNIRKHIDDLKEKQKSSNHKKDEVFKRIKIYAFIKLALACAAELSSNECDTDNQPNNSNVHEAPDTSSKRCYANVLMGIGELDLGRKKVHSSPTKPAKLMPYLLLDVRDRDAFCQCHIKTAKLYPSAMLSRSIGFETEDMKLYKNCIGAIIILYDDDETIGTRVATTLVERGYENVFLLTGGLKLALEICPHGLTTSSQLTPVHLLHGEANIAQKSTTKEHFSQEDIATIQHYVDTYPRAGNNFLMSSTASSRSRTRSVGTGYRNSLDSATTSHTSASSRRECSCSSSNIHQRQSSVNRQSSKQSHSHSNSAKSIEQTHLNKLQSLINGDTKKIKKAPWK